MRKKRHAFGYYDYVGLAVNPVRPSPSALGAIHKRFKDPRL
jgi:hypothetical protein